MNLQQESVPWAVQGRPCGLAMEGILIMCVFTYFVNVNRAQNARTESSVEANAAQN